MTFSVCVRETYEDDGSEAVRFGAAVTTRLPGVGALCPFVSERAAVATQGMVNVELGRRGVAYIEDGLHVADALEALLNADDDRGERQLHGVGPDGTFAFTGAACHGWAGAVEGDGYTVAGNFLTGESVVAAAADAYESGDRAEPLAGRLVDVLAAGQAAGGDRRETLTVQSAAVSVATTARAPSEGPAYGNDVRVDASESPVRDLRETYRRATAEFADVAAEYEREERD